MTNQTQLPNLPQELLELLKHPQAMPPVHKWKPERKGEVDILVKRNGEWWFQDQRMERESLIQLFSRILLKEGDEYFLVTPAEKMKIKVEAFPFFVRLANIEGAGEKQRVVFSTNVGDTFELGSQHALRMHKTAGGELLPVVLVRDNLEALVSRQVYYQLSDHMVLVPGTEGTYGVWSNGDLHELNAASA
jgi:uncharacterized protein